MLRAEGPDPFQLIVVDTIWLKKLSILLLECARSVMLFLRVDVPLQCFEAGRPNGEGAISSLPRETRQGSGLGLKPFRGRCLEILYKLRDRDGARHAHGQMNVICNASHPKAFATGIARYRGKVAIEYRSYRRVKDGRTVFGAENDMNKNTGERLRHAEEHKSGLQPSSIAWIPKTQADGLGWYDPAPSVLTFD
jgi:hypothetical protein